MAGELYATKIDVSKNELYRTYTYANGARYRIDGPSTVYIMGNGSHRVVDDEGVTHRPSENFVGISWKPRPGTPAFVA